MADPETSRKIASALAKMHTVEMPLAKDSSWIENSLERWLQQLQDDILSQEVNALPCDLQQEFLWICRELLPNITSPIVFCHNDLQEGNILLINDQGHQRLQIIDYDYCSYNYRGFDLANQFCEWTLDYSVSHPPYFEFKESTFPSQEQQLIFIKAYLEELSKHCSFDITHVEQSMLKEIYQFVPVSHFLWAVWALVQAKSSGIEFDYKVSIGCSTSNSGCLQTLGDPCYIESSLLLFHILQSYSKTVIFCR